MTSVTYTSIVASSVGPKWWTGSTVLVHGPPEHSIKLDAFPLFSQEGTRFWHDGS